tara:strand:+ start:849 stop:1277 length:429 start_codon:yes stop_codon:yes gene_type:complete
MSLYEDFKTSDVLETKGVRFENATYAYTLARSGGANKKFQKFFERLARPHRRQMDNGTLDNDVAERIMRQVYARTVVLGWETLVDDEWVDGIQLEDGSVVPATEDVLIQVFTDLPDLFSQISEDAKSVTYFRQAGMEDDAGN